MAYRRADFPKPKNLVGLNKDIQIPEMQKLLLANITMNEDAVRDLALQRGVVTRDCLLAQQVPTELLFVGHQDRYAERPSEAASAVDVGAIKKAAKSGLWGSDTALVFKA